MARKKTEDEINNVKTADNNTPEIKEDVVENNFQEAKEDVVENNVPEVKESDAKNSEKAPVSKEKKIPEAAKRILKVFSNHEKLYVSADGRVYTADSKPAVVGNAILYKNPYFNN